MPADQGPPATVCLGYVTRAQNADVGLHPDRQQHLVIFIGRAGHCRDIQARRPVHSEVAVKAAREVIALKREHIVAGLRIARLTADKQHLGRFTFKLNRTFGETLDREPPPARKQLAHNRAVVAEAGIGATVRFVGGEIEVLSVRAVTCSGGDEDSGPGANEPDLGKRHILDACRHRPHPAVLPEGGIEPRRCHQIIETDLGRSRNGTFGASRTPGRCSLHHTVIERTPVTGNGLQETPERFRSPRNSSATSPPFASSPSGVHSSSVLPGSASRISASAAACARSRPATPSSVALPSTLPRCRHRNPQGGSSADSPRSTCSSSKTSADVSRPPPARTCWRSSAAGMKPAPASSPAIDPRSSQRLLCWF